VVIVVTQAVALAMNAARFTMARSAIDEYPLSRIDLARVAHAQQRGDPAIGAAACS
jgi:hypothetical protein